MLANFEVRIITQIISGEMSEKMIGKTNTKYTVDWENDYEISSELTPRTKEEIRGVVSDMIKRYDVKLHEYLVLDEIRPLIWIVRDANGCPFVTLNLKEVG